MNRSLSDLIDGRRYADRQVEARRAAALARQKVCAVCGASYTPRRLERPERALCYRPTCEREHERQRVAARTAKRRKRGTAT